MNHFIGESILGSETLPDDALKSDGVYIGDEPFLIEHVFSLMGKGYYLCNFKPGHLQLHRPDHQGGGSSGVEVRGELANELAKRYDPWNYNVYQMRGEL